jgi:hypothetical protein
MHQTNINTTHANGKWKVESVTLMEDVAARIICRRVIAAVKTEFERAVAPAAAADSDTDTDDADSIAVGVADDCVAPGGGGRLQEANRRHGNHTKVCQLGQLKQQQEREAARAEHARVGVSIDARCDRLALNPPSQTFAHMYKRTWHTHSAYAHTRM